MESPLSCKADYAGSELGIMPNQITDLNNEDERMKSFLDALDDAGFGLSDNDAKQLERMLGKERFDNFDRAVIKRLQKWHGNKLVW